MNNNYFDLFQLPVLLPIDLSKLNLQYQQLQKRYHPDNYALVSDAEKATMMQKSATINVAYQTLKDPLKAAEYRISLAGINVNERYHAHDTSFLMWQFTLREQLDEIKQTQDWDRLESFHADMRKEQQQIYSQLLDDINHASWQKAKQQLDKLYYFSKLIEQIEFQQEQQVIDL